MVINHAQDFGISVDNPSIDFPSIIKSRDVADGMSKGVTYLLKKNKVDVIYGYGRVKKDKKVSS